MFLIVDGHGMAHRCYHANARNLRHTWDEGLFGYLMLDQLRAAIQAVESQLRRRREPPSYVRILVCWDLPSSKAARVALFPGYKAHRKPAPTHLAEWIASFRKRIGDTQARYNLAVESLEADDLIAIIVQEALDGVSPAVVITRDQDLLQLLRFDGVELYDPREKVFTDRALFEARFGFGVEWWNLYRAAIGDKSDGWPGIEGTGPVGMGKAIANAIADGWDPEKMIREMVRDGHGETLALGLQLVTLPFPEADYQAALSTFARALDDARIPDWEPVFWSYRINGLDPEEVGGWLT